MLSALLCGSFYTIDYTLNTLLTFRQKYLLWQHEEVHCWMLFFVITVLNRLQLMFGFRWLNGLQS